MIRIKFKNANRKGIFLCLWACLVTALYPVAYLYLANIEEAGFSDIVSSVGFSLLLMALLVLISLVFTRDFVKTSIVASIAFLVFVNYSMLQNLAVAVVPSAKYWHIAPIVVVVTIHILFLICKLMPKDLLEIVQVVLGIVFSALIVINLATTIPSIISSGHSGGTAHKEAVEKTTNNNISEQEYPNIYYLLFDEYSNFPVLEKFYQYDNQEFKEFLEDRGFETSLDSYNECGATVVVTTNNLNLNYVADSTQNYVPHRDHPYLFQLLSDYGYNISYWSQLPIGWDDQAIEKSAARTVDGSSFWDIFIGRTIIDPFLANDSGSEYTKLFYDEFNFVDEHIKQQDSNSFVYVHFDFPHLPFLFDQDGNYVGIQNRNNTEDGKYYREQLIYTTKYIMKTVDKILDKDPDSIIILQSDHSMRYIGKPLGHGSLSKAEDYTNIFNSVYFGEIEEVPIAGLSSVNTLRTVLNQALGLDMEMLEVPFYG